MKIKISEWLNLEPVDRFILICKASVKGASK
jgi:hypothetical protein